MTEKEKILLQMYSSHKKKKLIVLFVIIALIVIIGSSIAVFLFISSQSFNLVNDTIIIEYGSQYTPSLSDFVNFDDNITEENTFFQCNIQNEEGKDYASIGEYKVDISHICTYQIKGKKVFERSITKTAKISITDTTPPVFDKSCPSELTFTTILNDEDKPDLSKKFTASDLSGNCTILIKDNAVDYKTANKYTIEVVASDNSNNSTIMNCDIS